mmetsp:Transcript_23866/g.75356  ORF Transcript_23866/g.75356 Transcript_23866/m.75356 type:complete len:220 (+) Transcript_23866:288-947(+)
MRLSGTVNMDIRTLRWESGKCLDRRVPIAGKYMPTEASNTRKLPSTAANEFRPAASTVLMAPAAMPTAPARTLSTGCERDRLLNAELPSMQEAMKQEKTLPKGTSPFAAAAFRAGGHCVTKMNMAASKSACTEPTARIRGSLRMMCHASPMVASWPRERLSPLSALPLLPVALASAGVEERAASECQVTPTSIAPTARNACDRVKGAVGPRLAAATPDN